MSEQMINVLGQFVTEVGNVEYVMFETILATSKGDANEVHKRFYSEPFGPKVAMLEEEIKHDAFDEHRKELDHLNGMLKKLVSQRNNIIHGETFHISRRGESKVFRVGFTRKNTRPWTGFDFKGNSENIFTADQIEDVITDCIAIKTDLDLIRQKVSKKRTGHQPPYLSHTFEIDWTRVKRVRASGEIVDGDTC